MSEIINIKFSYFWKYKKKVQWPNTVRMWRAALNVRSLIAAWNPSTYVDFVYVYYYLLFVFVLHCLHLYFCYCLDR